MFAEHQTYVTDNETSLLTFGENETWIYHIYTVHQLNQYITGNTFWVMTCMTAQVVSCGDKTGGQTAAFVPEGG